MPRERTAIAEPACVVCGCTQNNACDGGCSWVAADLCSQCERAWESAVQTIATLNRNKHWPRLRRVLQVARALREIHDDVAAELGAP
jgi:hypothetical protein